MFTWSREAQNADTFESFEDAGYGEFTKMPGNCFFLMRLLPLWMDFQS
jgi:hypothetical protein